MKHKISKYELLQTLIDQLGITEPWVLKAVRSLQYRHNMLLERKLTVFIQQYSTSQQPIENSPYILPTSQAELQGEMSIGYVIGRPQIRCKLPITPFGKHALICGSVGSGKTVLTLNIAEQALLNGVKGIRITDPKANEFVILAQKYPNILILHIKNIIFNLFDPPLGMNRVAWYSIIVNHFALCFNFWEGGESLILDSLIELSHIKEVTLTNLYNHIMHKKGYSQKDHVLKSTVLSRLRMLQHQFDSQIERSSDLLEALAEIPHIIIVEGLLSETESWFNEYLLLWDFYFRKHNPHKRTLTLRIYDECQHRLFNNQKEKNNHFGSATLISKLADESRALGLGIVAISQEPSSLIKSILNNSHTKFSLRLGSGQEIKIASDAMGLNKEQRNMIHYLEVGETIIRTGTGYLDPYPVKIDMFQFKKALPDHEFIRYQDEYCTTLLKETIHTPIPIVSVNESLDSYEHNIEKNKDKNIIKSRYKKTNRSLIENSKKISKKQNDLDSLFTIWLNLPVPFLSQGQIMKKADIKSGSKQATLKNQAVRSGLIITHKIQIGRTYSLIWEPTEKAYEMVGLNKPSHSSKGGYLHQFIAHHVTLWAKKQGFDPSIEYFLENKKAVDVVVKSDEAMTFYEIVISKPYEKELNNIEKDLATSLQPKELIFLVADNKIEKIFCDVLQSADLSENVRSIIKIKLAGDFIVS